MTLSRHDIARNLRESGTSVIPLKGKVPVGRWQRYQTEHATDDDLQHWYGNGHDYNVGRVCGAVSGGRLVLDFDDPKAFDEFGAKLRQDGRTGEFADATVTRTPSGGYHIDLLCPEYNAGSTKLAIDADGKVRIETRGEGGQAAFGDGYEHIGGPPLWKTGTFTVEQVEFLLSVARSLSAKKERQEVRRRTPHVELGDVSRPGDDYNARGPEWAELLEPHGWVFRGDTHDCVGRWVRPDKDADGISATTEHKPGLFYVFSSNAEPFESERGYSKFQVFALLECDGDFGRAAKVLAERGYGERREARSGADTGDGSSISPKSKLPDPVAIDMLRKRFGDGRIVYTRNTFYLYDASRGFWRACGRSENGLLNEDIHAVVMRALVEIEGGSTVGRVKTLTEGLEWHVADDSFFENANGAVDADHIGVTFGDCYVCVRPDGLMCVDHSPTQKKLGGYDFDFDAEATCEPWLELLGELFRDDEDRQQKIDCLQEFVGAALTGMATRFEKAALLFGEGSNGKSTFIEAMKLLFPAASCTGYEPSSFGDRFGSIGLIGSLLNVCAEIPREAVLKDGHVKAIISGDPIQAEHKFGSRFTYRPVAAHMFSLNRDMLTADQSPAFFRRWIIFEFNRRFGQDKGTFKSKGQIVDDIKGCVPGMALWALKGAARVLRNKGYTTPASSRKRVATWMAEADSVAAWLEHDIDILDDGAKERLSSSQAFRLYHKWCEDCGYSRSIRTITSFGNRMREIGVPSGKRSSTIYFIRQRDVESQQDGLF